MKDRLTAHATENRLRATFAHRAEDMAAGDGLTWEPGEVLVQLEPPGRERRRVPRARTLAAAAAVVVLAGGAAMVLQGGGDGSDTVRAGSQGTEAQEPEHEYPPPAAGEWPACLGDDPGLNGVYPDGSREFDSTSPALDPESCWPLCLPEVFVGTLHVYSNGGWTASGDLGDNVDPPPDPGIDPCTGEPFPDGPMRWLPGGNPIALYRPASFDPADTRRINVGTHDPSKPDGQIPPGSEQVTVGENTGYFTTEGPAPGHLSLFIPLDVEVIEFRSYFGATREDLLDLAGDFQWLGNGDHESSHDNWTISAEYFDDNGNLVGP